MIEVFKAVEGEGRLFGLPLSYFYYIMYVGIISIVTFLVGYLFKIAHPLTLIIAIIIPFIFYLFLRFKTRKSKRRNQLESFIAYRMMFKIIKTKKINKV